MMTMIQTPIFHVDVHGMTVEQAIEKVEDQIRKAGTGTYRILRSFGLRAAIIRESRNWS